LRIGFLISSKTKLRTAQKPGFVQIGFEREPMALPLHSLIPSPQPSPEGRGSRRLIGLTGNIATGKSHVAKRLRELGAIVIDADQLAREVVQPGQPALAEVVRVFGEDVLLPDGNLDRKKMAGIVFNDAAKLKQLEAITHPAVRVLLNLRIQEGLQQGHVVIEVIRLFEGGYAQQCDQVWVTHCPREAQIMRLMQSRGMTEAEATRRVDGQPSQADKLVKADVIIDTAGTHDDTNVQVDAAWRALVAGDDGVTS
jgi:dephospho-CoA kinase